MGALSGRQLALRFVLVTVALALVLVGGGYLALDKLDKNRKRNELGMTFAHLAESVARLEIALVRAAEQPDEQARDLLADAWLSTAYHWMLLDDAIDADPATTTRAIARELTIARIASWTPAHRHQFDGLTLPPSLAAIMESPVRGDHSGDLLPEVLTAVEPLAFGSGPLTHAEVEMTMTVRRALDHATLLEHLHGGSTAMIRYFNEAGAAMRRMLVAVVAGGVGALGLALGFFFLPLARRIERNHRRLAGALERARAGEQAKADFLATMSHELRTPLNGVLGMAALLETTQLDSRQRACVETIRSSGGALSTVIGDILEYSRLNDGSLILQSTSFASTELARGPAHKLGPAATIKGLELMIRLDPAVPIRLEGDLARLDHVITNLLANAVKFTSHGHVLVEISTTPKNSGHATLHVAVTDSGPGVPPDKAARIFALFEQGDQSMTRNVGGTGVGLAICQSLVTLMGGRIWLEPPGQGVGACFRLDVPLRVIDPAPWLGESEAIAGHRIGLVTGNATRRSMMAEALAAWGATVVTGATLGDLYDRHPALPPRIVIVDDLPPSCPAADSVDAVSRHWPEAAVIVLSGIDASFDHPRSRVLRKPVAPHILHDTLERLLADQAAEALIGDEAPPETAALRA